MSAFPLFSVVIPCYNQGRYLNETVQSVLASVYPNIEILLVDDGSTDDTAEVASQLVERHSNVHYFFQQNAGPSRARNHGISQAKGKYILPLDSDDLISADYISEAVKVLESREDVKLVYCEVEQFGERTGVLALRPFCRERIAMKNMIVCSAVYRKSDWKRCGGYDEKLRWVLEDWEFWINLLKNDGDVLKLPLVGLFYRIRPNSRSGNETKNRLREVIDYVNLKHKDYIYSQLNGPLRYSRKHSKKYNTLLRLLKLI